MKWKLGELSGVGVYLHWSFWILPAYVLLSGLGAGGGAGAALVAVLFVFAIFGCVVLHELGHALAARRYGIGTRDITLYPIGGVASLDRIPRRPGHELVIALAGPAVNVVIAVALCLGMMLSLGAVPASTLLAGSGSFLASLMWVNVALVVFNMLPAFPMDGGRVLRALLAMWLRYERATEIAARIGQVMAVLLGVAGVLSQQPALAFIAVFVFLAAQAEVSMSRMHAARAQSWFPASPVDPSVSTGTGVADDGIRWVTEVRTYDPRTGLYVVRRFG